MKKIRILSLLAVVSLAAYAGGANSSSDRSSTPTTSPAVNFKHAIQAALGWFETLSGRASEIHTADATPLLRFGKDQLPRLKEWLATEPAQAPGVTTSDAVPCSGGGSITYTYTYPSKGRGTLGGRYTLSADQCVEQMGTINGVLVATLQHWSESANGHSYQASLEYQNLSITSASGDLSGNGPLTLDHDEDFATGDASTAMFTPSFAVTAVHGTTTYSRTLTNYHTRYRDTAANSPLRMDGAVASTAAGGNSVTPSMI